MLKFALDVETEVWAKQWHRWEQSTLGSVLPLAMFHFLIKKRYIILLSYLASSEPGLGRTFGRITLGSDLGLNNLRPGNSKMAPGALLGHHLQQDLPCQCPDSGGPAPPAAATAEQVNLTFNDRRPLALRSAYSMSSPMSSKIFLVFFISYSFKYVFLFLKINSFTKWVFETIYSKVGTIAEPMISRFTVNQSRTFITIIIILCRFEIFSLPYLSPIRFWRKIAKRC